MKQYSRVYAKIDLDAIEYNMKQMKKRLGERGRFIAVIKTDGYGHGAVPIAQLFEDTEYVWGFAVATLDEAVALRKNKIKKPILVLGCVFPEQYETMIQYEIRAAAYCSEIAEDISKTAERIKKKAYLHIKIDTGMGRIGFPVTEASAECISRICSLPYIEAEGMFTHFAKADETDKTYTHLQHDKFLWMADALEKRGVRIPYQDCDNSAGIIDFPSYRHDLARAGISLYGLYPSDEVDKEKVPLKPALELISHVTFVKEVEPGTSISYGGTFIADKKMRIATIPVGYGDGYPRSLSNKGEVLIHGRRARILGRVCMDQFMVDVTDIPDVKFMDEVVLIGRDGEDFIPVEELSEISGRFNYEFVCCLGKRIPRVYVKNGRITAQSDSF